MIWGTDDNPPAKADAKDDRDGAPSAAPGASADAGNPLSLLARKLGALEQSLTVVASEIGVSGMPQFKHLDADKVYAEAIRVARQAAEQAHKDLDDRTREISAATAVLNVRLDSELHGLVARIGDLDTRLDALLQQLEALRRRSEEQRQLAPGLAILQQRLEALENRPQPQPAQAQQPQDGFVTDALRRRLDLLEAQIQTPAAPPQDNAEWPFAEDGSPRHAPPPGPPQIDVAALQRNLEADARQRLAQIAGELEARLLGQIERRPVAPSIDTAVLQQDVDAAVAQRVAQIAGELEARLLNQIERRLDQINPLPPVGEAMFGNPPAHNVTAADVQGLRDLIATELGVLLSRRAERNEQVPLLAERNADINPLVVTAAERAIVRLTHRIEKLESRLDGDGSGETRRSSGVRPGSRPSRGIVGRLFEG